MKTALLLPLLVSALLCPALFAAPSVRAESASAPPAPRSVQARFLQEKHLPILAQPMSSRGTFAFQAPRSLRWEYLYPVHTLLLAHKGTVKKLVEQDGRLTPDPNMRPDAMNLVLEEITAWLSGRFEDNPAFAVSRPDAKTIALTPKDAGLAAVISRIDLHLSGDEGLLDEVIIHEGPEAWTRLSFSDATLNRPLAETLFTEP